MQTFQAENEPTKMRFRNVCRKIPGVPSPQWRNRRGPNQSNGHSDHEATSHNEGLKSFQGKVSYIQRFIPSLSSITPAFMKLLKKGQGFEWGEA